jgi:hypothetical protein
LLTQVAVLSKAKFSQVKVLRVTSLMVSIVLGSMLANDDWLKLALHAFTRTEVGDIYICTLSECLSEGAQNAMI